MKATIHHKNQTLSIDLSQPIDISIPLSDTENPLAWYLEKPEITPVRSEDWVGKVSEGGDVNFNTITFNPHAHGTHTECVGHITEKVYSINKHLTQFFFTAELITVAAEPRGEDFVISKKQLQYDLKGKNPEALVIRTIPNIDEKKTKNWSHTNWTYIEEEAMVFLRRLGVKHLLVDVPSVDREKDEGELKAHKAFWNLEGNIRMDATITEMIYVPHQIADGRYILNLQIAPFENDATPSKPILYKIE
ncbi:arylformamidase [Dokdonia pacifica]|uniref:Kynurenine formamidase n=1 Tax=Dokdonia pacifica TaxID=1627892 RepID=A0A238ZYU4_9FLAO|nr:cyclase family protein [Dokdonia pacifica]GGG33911.1 arylformamidase [Dokdonia pacifica]SNR88181.1 Kynurenine formamidase [Dokdonia pacifica]